MKCTNAIHRPGYFTLQLLHLSVIENILYKEVLCTGLFHLCIIMIMWNLGTESNKGCFMRNSDFVIEIWRRRKSRHCTWSLVYCFPFPFGAMKPNIAWHPLVSPQIRVGWQILKNSSRSVRNCSIMAPACADEHATCLYQDLQWGSRSDQRSFWPTNAISGHFNGYICKIKKNGEKFLDFWFYSIWAKGCWELLKKEISWMGTKWSYPGATLPFLVPKGPF